MHDTDEPSARPVGGMAIIEGVMMRGADRWAAAVRRPDGEIELATGPLPGWAARYERVPFARGIATLAESFTIGVRALVWSGALADPRATAPVVAPARIRVAHLVLPALAMATGLFFLLPAAVAHLVASLTTEAVFGITETVARLATVVGYLLLIGRLPDVRRLFAYHGAEHKAVAAHESGDALTVDAARAHSTRHSRCGTTFLLVVIAIASLLHLAITSHDPVVIGASRVALVPVVAAIAFEVLRAAAANPTRAMARALLRPGLALQSLTTAEPDDEQLAVALAALTAALAPAERLAPVSVSSAPAVAS